MADSLPPSNDAGTVAAAPVVVKKYANRRLYNTETSSYITLDNLAEMIRAGRDFVVYDAKSGEDITRGVLTQIIVEEESKGSSMLPTTFLRQLIGFYGDSLQGVVPRYLEQAMSNFARQQQQMRQVMQQTFSPFLPAGVEEMGRQNLALMERAMSMFNPFHRPGDAKPAAEVTGKPATEVTGKPGTEMTGKPVAADAAPAAAPPAHDAEKEALRHEVESLRAQLAIARAEAVITHQVPHPVPAAEALPAPIPETAFNVVADAPAELPAELLSSRKPRSGRRPA